MITTRRGLLGMFAAGAAAAILPSGISMPVRRIVTPDEIVGAHFDAVGRYLAALQDAVVERHLLGVDYGSGDRAVLTWWEQGKDGRLRVFERVVPRSEAGA